MNLRRYPAGRRVKIHCRNGVVFGGVVKQLAGDYLVMQEGAVLEEECDPELQADSEQMEEARRRARHPEPLVPQEAIDFVEVMR